MPTTLKDITRWSDTFSEKDLRENPRLKVSMKDALWYGLVPGTCLLASGVISLLIGDSALRTFGGILSLVGALLFLGRGAATLSVVLADRKAAAKRHEQKVQAMLEAMERYGTSEFDVENLPLKPGRFVSVEIEQDGERRTVTAGFPTEDSPLRLLAWGGHELPHKA